STRQDFFAAAQFLEMSQDDRMTKPSFEHYTAGYELNDDDYELGEIVEETLNYEEADLGAPRTSRKFRRIGLGIYAAAMHAPLMKFGSAGLSTLRDKGLSQPATPSALRVNPAPMVVADKSSLQATPHAAVHSSFWKADQARRFALDQDLAAMQ